MTIEELQQTIALLEEKLADCQKQLQKYENRENYSLIFELEQDKKNLLVKCKKKEKEWKQQESNYQQTIQALKLERRKKLTQISSLLAEKNKLRAQLASAKNQLKQTGPSKTRFSEQRLLTLSDQLTDATQKMDAVTALLQQQLENPSSPSQPSSSSFTEPLQTLEQHIQELFAQSVIAEKQLQAKLTLLHELEQQLALLSDDLEKS